MTHIRYILLSLIAVVSIRCANQSSPTGGPKDEDPPQLESSIPEDQQLNYTDSKVELVFNELIKIDNVKEQLIITPKIDQEYEAKYKKDKLILEFEEPLDSNTTYTLIFRESVKDLTEGNVPPNLILAFSTGAYMDSLSISGSVIDLLTQQVVKDATVSLYQADDTLDLFNSEPTYLAKTNKKGIFKINNIKNDTYKLYTVADKNKNLKLEPSSEKYGFHPDTIKLDSNLTDIKMKLIGLDTSPLELQNARKSGHYYIIKYNKYITNYSIQSSATDSIYSSINKEGKEIKLYNTFTIADSLMLTIQATDSMNFQKLDTVYLKFEETKRDKDEYDIKIINKLIDPQSPELDITINFSKPSHVQLPDSLYVELDTLNKITFTKENFTWNNHRSQLLINKLLDKSALVIPDSVEAKTKSSLNLYMGQLAFMSVEQDSSKAKQKKINVIKAKNVGLIKVEISTDKTSYFVQLLNKKNEVVEEVKNIKAYSFNNLKPGEYRIRVLIDSNDDGSWNMGNILTSTPAESVIFYESSDGKQVLTLRANWELGPNTISF